MLPPRSLLLQFSVHVLAIVQMTQGITNFDVVRIATPVTVQTAPPASPDDNATVRAEGDLDFRGTLGVAKDVVLELNRQALAKLQATKELVVVPGATHLFEEPGALEEVARPLSVH